MNPQINTLEIALKISEFIKEKWEIHNEPYLLEGILLALQMIGGPSMAAVTIRQSIPTLR